MAYTKVINGTEVSYPSVTTILGMLSKGDALNYWAAGCAVDYISENLEELRTPSGPHRVDEILRNAKKAFKDASQKALDTGSAVHDAIEQYIKTGRDPSGEMSDQAQHGFLAFLDWEKKNHVEWVSSELELISEKRGYAGTCDAIARINGYLYLVDFKTSKAIYDEYRFQLGAYLQAYNEENVNPAVGQLTNVGILRLDKETGEPEWKDVSMGIDKRMRAFNVLTVFYYTEKKRRLKNNPFVNKYWGAA